MSLGAESVIGTKDVREWNMVLTATFVVHFSFQDIPLIIILM